MMIQRRHIRIFFIHFLLWTLFYAFLLPPFFFQLGLIPPDMPIRLVVTVLLFYLNYFFLVPKFLLKKKTAIYIVFCLLIVGVSGVFINFYFSPEPAMPIPLAREEGIRIKVGHSIPMPPLFTIFNLCIPIFISAFLRIYVEWKRNEDLRKKVENEKVSSELQFLKTQLNPHFLFNSLNAIYSLSVKGSPSTSGTIISLSELMRYMLYEADRDKVPLEKEVEYIKNYVQLQRLRLSDSANVKLKISGQDKGKEIAPLLFISFIENAFKYGTDYKGSTYVDIALLITENTVQLRVENIIGVHRQKKKDSGVGLENTKNRLCLLYPDSHELSITDNGKTYKVDLTLVLRPMLKNKR